MTDEDDEFNRIEREAAMRKAAVHATVTKKPWQGLTQEEFERLIDEAGFTRSDLLMIGACVEQIVVLVEAKLKAKNEM